MITLDQKFEPEPNVVKTDFGEKEVVLLHLKNATYYSLNQTGARIWKNLNQGLTLREVSQRLQQEFDVDAERADRGVLSLIEELAELDLVQVVD